MENSAAEAPRTKKYVTIENIMGESFKLYFKNILKFALPVAAISALVIGLIIFGIFFGLSYLNINISDLASSLEGSSDSLFTENMIEDDMYMVGNMFVEYFESGQLFVHLAAATLFFTIIGLLINLYLIRTAANTYLKREESLAKVLSFSLANLVPYFAIALLIGLAVSMGLLILYIPGIILALGLGISKIVYLEEKPGILKSFKRSWQLMSGHKFTFLLILILMSILTQFFSGALFGIFSSIASIFGGFTVFTGSPLNIIIIFATIMGLAPIIFYSIIIPLQFIFPVVLYFNIRKEKEGFSEEEIGNSNPSLSDFNQYN